MKGSQTAFSVPLEMLLDTGATKVMIPSRLAQLLGISPTGLDHNVGTAVGTEDLPTTVIPSIQIRGSNNLAVSEVEAWIGETFLLGMSFLRHFNLRIDHGRKLVIEA